MKERPRKISRTGGAIAGAPRHLITPPSLETRPAAPAQCADTFATQALAAGIAVAEVSRYLGHSSIAVTLTVYAHVLPGGHDAARAKLAGFYDGVRPRAEGETEVKQLADSTTARALSR